MSDQALEILALFLANAGLIVWFRAESRSDWRHMDNKLDSYMREMQEERRDFHDRLCAIEDRKKNNTNLKRRHGWKKINLKTT